MTARLQIGLELLRLTRQTRLNALSLRQHRTQAFRRFVTEALVHSRFHRQRLAAVGLDVADLTEPDQLSALPVMEREDLRSQPEAIANTAVPVSRRRELRTSGSSGVPLCYWVTPEEQATRHALHLRACRLAGRRLLDREAVIGSTPPPSIRRQLWQRSIYLSALVHPVTLRSVLSAFAPDHLIAFPSTLMELGEEPGWRPKLVTTGSEVLEPSVRRALETRFGAPVRDIYGSIETGLLAFQCSSGDGYHLNEDEVIFEWLPAADGVSEVVVTPLHARAMPLVRYRLGDLLRPLGGACPCGSTLARIASIEGRRDDWLLRPDGCRVPPGAVRVLFRRGERLFRYRVTQDERGDVLLELAAERGAEADVGRLGLDLASILGRPVQLEIRCFLPPDASGKLCAIRRIDRTFQQAH